jgi:retron-type reverse transcriptase
MNQDNKDSARLLGEAYAEWVKDNSNHWSKQIKSGVSWDLFALDYFSKMNQPERKAREKLFNYSFPLPAILREGKKADEFANLIERAIKVNKLNKSGNKTRILGTPWVKFPVCAKFHISLNGMNLLAKHYGIEKKLEPDIYIVPLKNRNYNRYLEWNIRRLNTLRSNPHKYWAVVWILMKRSNVFRVAAINHVFPQWQRKLPLSFVINVNRKVSNLINNKSFDLKIVRRYIEKGNDSYRPLGVPAAEWRVLLHMVQNFLLQFIGEDHFVRQHAYLPHRGTLTCWQEIMKKKLYEYPFIYSWDFKQFFPNVKIDYISRELRKFNVPEWVVEYLSKINKSIPKLEEHDLVHEPDRDVFITNSLEPNPENPDSADPEVNWIIRNMRRILTNSIRKLSDWSNVPSDAYARNDFDKFIESETKQKGVAQGAPTSPILANLVMQNWINQTSNGDETITVGYADDSYTFSKKAIKLTDPRFKPHPATGIVISKTKSFKVKQNGTWLAPMDFLGLRLDKKVLSANTRKGSKLVFNSKVAEFLKLEETRLEQGIELNKVQQVLEFIDKSKKLPYSSSGSWFEYFKNKTVGFAMSRLYNGEWNLEHLEQDFSYSYGKTSWSALIGTSYSVDLDIFNSSSYASQSLVKIFQWNQKSKHNKKKKYFLKVDNVLQPTIRFVKVD